MPLITIVTGTYNRAAALQRMVISARASVPDGVGLDFVVVDGGSTDGTQAWARSQPDVTLIEHGALLGAIRAFCDGARAARGEYVLLANDDIVIEGDAILRAFTHLETHPTCGAVAFADNRPAPGYGAGYKVQTISMQTPDGKQVSVPYPQVALVRRWLGDACGWWGADDPVMGKGSTYGGDSYLGARIWEYGYSVDTLASVRITDSVIADGLREHNMKIEQRTPGVYYKRFPTPPTIAARPALESPQSERMRILYLPIFEPGNALQRANKRGLYRALSKLALVYQVDYLNEPFNLPALVEAFQPHLMLTQLHGADRITPLMLAAARAGKPDMVVVNWNGDAHVHGLTAEPVMQLLRYVDLQLVVNAYALPVYEAWNIRARYWQIGYEETPGELPDAPEHDIVFLGNCNAPTRRALETALVAEARHSGLTLGLYGDGWKNPAGNTLYDFAAGEAIYRKCKIAIGDQFWGQTYAFVSNRFFQALAAGAFLLQEQSSGLDEYTGLEDGVHYVSWKGHADLQLKIRYWNSPKRDRKRREIAEAGRVYVREHFNFDEQVRKLFEELLPTIQAESEAVR